VAAALDQLEQVGGVVMGAVLNRSDARAASGYKYHGGRRIAGARNQPKRHPSRDDEG
jgi:Mrp family chromosome partitioning ATPase